MKIRETGIAGLLFVELEIYRDNRGSFRESYNAEKFEAAGYPRLVITQANISHSRYGVIRGIHAEPWDKYIHVTRGKVFAAIVDFRKDSPTFGRVETFELDETCSLLVPAGCGNSFAAVTQYADYTYMVTGVFQPGIKYPAVAYDDPELGIPWPIVPEDRIVSDKDQHNPTFREAYGS